jgi:Integrase core domain
MESFFSSLKVERVARKIYRTRDQARADVFDYIERFYNPRRGHSTIGYLSPIAFEQKARISLGWCLPNRQRLSRLIAHEDSIGTLPVQFGSDCVRYSQLLVAQFKLWMHHWRWLVAKGKLDFAHSSHGPNFRSRRGAKPTPWPPLASDGFGSCH